MALGTRGDVEPLLAVGGILKDRGHDVICGLSEQFRELVKDAGMQFYPFTKTYLQIIESETGISIMGQKGSFLQKIRSFYKMYRQIKPIQKELARQQSDFVKQHHPDRVIYNMKCLYPTLWGMANPKKSAMILPIPGTLHKVLSYSPVLPHSKFAHHFNHLIFWLVHNTYPKQIKDYTRSHHEEFPGVDVSTKAIKRFILKEQKAIYTISPTIFERPDFWPKNAIVVGYHERIRTSSWKPEQDLLRFLDNHPKILLVTFGSMVSAEPEHKTGDILALLQRHKISAIINTASGGLIKPLHYPDHIYFTKTLPYEWIFPKVYAVIHHGGSGTTHTALKYGCASMVIPHILDQFFWSYIIAHNELGPKGISIKKLNLESLEPLLLDLMEKGKYKQNAERIATQMQKEALERSLEI